MTEQSAAPSTKAVALHFNGLTPAEAERLALLAEECGELVQAIGKVLRHGICSYHPTTRVGNKEALEKEMGDVYAAMMLACEEGLARYAVVHMSAHSKSVAVQRYLHHGIDRHSKTKARMTEDEMQDELRADRL